MTTDLEKQFFDTFGIVPTLKYYCPSCDTELEKWLNSDGIYYRCANNLECDYFLDTQSEDFEECLNYLNSKLIYPQITSDKWLELITLLNINTSKRLYIEDAEDLKAQTLKGLISCHSEMGAVVGGCDFKEVQDILVEQVRTLFEEG